MILVRVVSGDITQITSDAIITAIYSGSDWSQGVDGAIRRVAGSIFHDQILSARPLVDGQTILAPKNGRSHRGAFRDVVFVVDNGLKPLSEIICSGLMTASGAGFKNVTLPAIRFGKMRGIVESSDLETAQQISMGVEKFSSSYPHTSMEEITFVVYNEPHIYTLLNYVLE